MRLRVQIFNIICWTRFHLFIFSRICEYSENLDFAKM